MGDTSVTSRDAPRSRRHRAGPRASRAIQPGRRARGSNACQTAAPAASLSDVGYDVETRASCLLSAGRKPERLGPGEVAPVLAPVRHSRGVLSRDDLGGLAPAESLDVNDRAVDTRVARLRRKLDTGAIVTVRGAEEGGRGPPVASRTV